MKKLNDIPYLRGHGVDALVTLILDEVPELADDKRALEHLREWTAEESIAMYDIQCYSIKDKIRILGHEFDGLADIIGHREILGKESYRGFECFALKDANVCQDVHVGELYENYPVFDSYDLGDDRTYQNYIFRNKAITRRDMKKAFAVYHKGNFCMVHERIPEKMLPVLYYQGDGQYMLLASSKPK